MIRFVFLFVWVTTILLPELTTAAWLRASRAAASETSTLAAAVVPVLDPEHAATGWSWFFGRTRQPFSVENAMPVLSEEAVKRLKGDGAAVQAAFNRAQKIARAKDSAKATNKTKTPKETAHQLVTSHLHRAKQGEVIVLHSASNLTKALAAGSRKGADRVEASWLLKERVSGMNVYGLRPKNLWEAGGFGAPNSVAKGILFRKGKKTMWPGTISWFGAPGSLKVSRSYGTPALFATSPQHSSASLWASMLIGATLETVVTNPVVGLKNLTISGRPLTETTLKELMGRGMLANFGISALYRIPGEKVVHALKNSELDRYTSAMLASGVGGAFVASSSTAKVMRDLGLLSSVKIDKNSAYIILKEARGNALKVVKITLKGPAAFTTVMRDTIATFPGFLSRHEDTGITAFLAEVATDSVAAVGASHIFELTRVKYLEDMAKWAATKGVPVEKVSVSKSYELAKEAFIRSAQSLKQDPRYWLKTGGVRGALVVLANTAYAGGRDLTLRYWPQ